MSGVKAQQQNNEDSPCLCALKLYKVHSPTNRDPNPLSTIGSVGSTIISDAVVGVVIGKAAPGMGAALFKNR